MKYKIILKSGAEMHVKFAPGVISPIDNYMNALKQGADPSKSCMSMNRADGKRYCVVNLGEIAVIEEIP